MEILYAIYPIIFVGIIYLVFVQADRIVARNDERWRKTLNEMDGRHMVEAKEKDKMIFRLAMLISAKGDNLGEFARAVDKIEEEEKEPLSNNDLYRRVMKHIQSEDIKGRQAANFGGG